jgi:formamidopyrimidine-DNA glycosylase
VLGSDEADAYLAARLGLEPLEREFSARDLGDRLAERRASVKAALLDQRILAGVGNIYADEALWRAQIDPRRSAGGLDAREIGKLHRSVRRALEAGIARQGATLRDYRTPDGAVGGMQHEFKVYGRGGEPCLRCGTPIEKAKIAGRGTWFCPGCQR